MPALATIKRQKSYSKIRAFMNSSPLSLLLVAALTLCGGMARAEKADRNKPIFLASDSLRYDDLKQISVWTGHVVLTKGTIVIRGEKLEMRQDAQGNQFGLVNAEPGKLAFFRQKREGLDEFIEGEGETIEYDSRADTVKFATRAQLRRYRGASLSDELSGAVILYNNTTDVFNIDGAPSHGSTGVAGGRVRAMLTPQQNTLVPGTANPVKATPRLAPVPDPTLRSSTTLGAEKNE
jgi:lipopolysaccharide export system protein LptA